MTFRLIKRRPTSLYLKNVWSTRYFQIQCETCSQVVIVHLPPFKSATEDTTAVLFFFLRARATQGGRSFGLFGGCDTEKERVYETSRKLVGRCHAPKSVNDDLGNEKRTLSLLVKNPITEIRFLIMSSLKWMACWRRVTGLRWWPTVMAQSRCCPIPKPVTGNVFCNLRFRSEIRVLFSKVRVTDIAEVFSPLSCRCMSPIFFQNLPLSSLL